MLAVAPPQHYFAAAEPLNVPARLRAVRAMAARRALPMPLTGALKLSRTQDTFVVTAATPGIQLENVSIELVGQRTLRLRVTQAWTSAGEKPAPPTAAPLVVSRSEHHFAAAPETLEDTAHDDERGFQDTSEEDSGNKEAPIHCDEEAPVHATAAAPYYAADDSVTCRGHAQPALNEVHMVVLDKSLELPQLVDAAGIICSYTEGLLRVEIPIADPAPDTEHETLMAKLQEDKTSAVDQLSVCEQRVKECKDAVRATHAALRTAKAAAGPTLARRAQVLAIVPGDLSVELARSTEEGLAVAAAGEQV